MSSYWDLLLSCPGLSHLATEIFLRVDMDTFGRLEQVCKAWKRHFDSNNDLWKRKLLISAEVGSGSREIIKEATDKDIRRDDLSKLCRSLCSNHSWFGSMATLRGKKRGSQGILSREANGSHVAALGQGMILIGENSFLHVARVSSPSNGVRWEAHSKAFDDPHEKITAMDVSDGGGEFTVVTGSSKGGIRVWTYDYPTTPRDGSILGKILLWTYWSSRTLRHVAEADPFSRAPVSSVKFGPSGDLVASCWKSGAAALWSFDHGEITLRQDLRLIEDFGWCFWLETTLAGGHGRWTFPLAALSKDWLIVTVEKGVAILPLEAARNQAVGKVPPVLFQTEVPAEMSCLLALRSIPGLAVTGDSEPSLRVWDLDGMGLLIKLTELWGDPEDLYECPQAGVLAISLHRETPAVFYSSGIMLLPTEGIRLGIFVGTFVEMYDGDYGAMSAAAISPAGIHAITQERKLNFYFETFSHMDTEANGDDHRNQRIVKKKVVRLVHEAS